MYGQPPITLQRHPITVPFSIGGRPDLSVSGLGVQGSTRNSDETG